MTLQIGKTDSRGFLLLEVLISLLILSICIVLIMASFMKSMEAIELSEDYFKAGLLFQQKIYGIHNSRIEEGLSEARFTDFADAFSWQLRMVSLEEQPLVEGTLRVLWQRRNKNHSLSAITYIR